jgi:hypothetical protein
MAADQQLVYENLPSVANEQERMALLGRISIVKLNGGLGEGRVIWQISINIVNIYRNNNGLQRAKIFG